MGTQRQKVCTRTRRGGCESTQANEMADLKAGSVRYLAPEDKDGKSKTGTWHTLTFRVNPTEFGPESPEEQEGHLRATVKISEITGVHVYLGGRFDISRRDNTPMCLLVQGGSTTAWLWADAIHAARIGVTPPEAYRLRTFFRPCVIAHDNPQKSTGHSNSLDLRRLQAQMQRLGEEFAEDDLEGLRLGPDLKVVPCNQQACELLRAITSKVVDTEVIEVWENGRVEGALLQEEDPPGFQRGDGSALSSAEMVRGLHESWFWLCDWEVDKDPLLFGPEGWQHATSFVRAEWHRIPRPALNVRRRRWFRVQVHVPWLSSVTVLGSAGDSAANPPPNPTSFKSAAAISLDSLSALAVEMANEAKQPRQHETRKLLQLAVAANRCVRGNSAFELLQFLVPGQPNYIDLSAFDVSVPEAEPPEQLAQKLSMLLLEALDGLSPARLALKAFCEAGKFQHNKPNVDQAAENNSTGAGPEHSLYEPSEASRKPAVQGSYSFQMTKVNQRGKHQERLLQLTNDGVRSYRGDSLRFHYTPEEIHGIHPNHDECGFDLCLITRISYIATSPQQRLQVIEALDNLQHNRPAQSGLAQGRQLLATMKNMKNKPACLADFDVVMPIGKGGMGKIFMVKSKMTGKVFAMKVQKVAQLLKAKLLDRARNEMQILLSLHHPFLVRLHYCFVDNNQLCMLLDFCDGGDLFHFTRKLKSRKLHHMAAGFYIGEVVLALEYLHAHEIIHRDLKPENILMGPDGHLKLTDFGLSRMNVTSEYGNDGDLGRAESLVGTREYVSPEVVLRKSYGLAVDWWAVGILLYEMLVGRPPFDARAGGDVFAKIVSETHQWPASVPVVTEVQDLTNSLLSKNPEQRPQAAQIKNHPFFVDVFVMDWNALMCKKIEPPIKPNIETRQNFPSKYTNETNNSFVEQSPALASVDIQAFTHVNPHRLSDSYPEGFLPPELLAQAQAAAAEIRAAEIRA